MLCYPSEILRYLTTLLDHLHNMWVHAIDKQQYVGIIRT